MKTTSNPMAEKDVSDTPINDTSINDGKICDTTICHIAISHITVTNRSRALGWLVFKIMCSVALAVFTLPAVAEQQCLADVIVSSAPAQQYQVRKDGTVVDYKHHLMWKRCLEGKTGEACAAGELNNVHWADALLWIAKHNTKGFAGFSDWRLPNVRELATLTEMQCQTPAINRDVFASAPAVHVWSSSPYHFYTHYSWYLDFDRGVTSYDDRQAEKALWLVRNFSE